MKKLVFVVVFLTCLFSFSQSRPFKIYGKVVAENDTIPIESATVYLERTVDSSLVTYTITDKNGEFSLQDQSFDDKINLSISSIGYQPYTSSLNLDKEEIYLGNIKLNLANELDAVLVNGRAPITIKKDTLEFNVKSFKTKKDANVEDLLKQLPGVEVDNAGTITVNGKPVNKILVNGKPFFGDDPTITTRNLTKEIIEKVQITDTKTKSEAFSGEEGDTENKTINLTIKEENNKGTFGRLSAGGGTDERYEFAGLVNYFDNDQRVSVLAGGNNTNSPGFSFGEIEKMFGRANSIRFNSNGNFVVDGRSFGGGEGITTSKNVGANYADVLDKGFDVSGDYFYSSSNSENESLTQREVILPDTKFFTNSTSTSINDNDNHSANAQFEIEIDTTFMITVDPSFQFSNNKNIFKSSEQTLNVDRVQTNSSDLNSFIESTGKNFSNRLSATKKFGSGGSFLKISVDTELDNVETEDFIASQTIFNDETQNILRDQFSDDNEELKSLFSRFTYRLPLISKKFFLDMEYELRNENRESVRSTFDFDDTSQEYTIFNEALSTDFKYTNNRSTPSLELVYRDKEWSASTMVGYVFRTLENTDDLRPELNLKQNFEAMEFRTRFHRRFNPKMSMSLGYSLDNQPPQLRQLRPFQDVSNPLNIITGNPNLDPTNNHRIYMNFNNFDWQSRTGFYGYVSANFINDQIVSKTTVDSETLARETTYTNVDGVYRYSVSTSYSKDVKIDTLKTLKFRLGIWANANRNINFNNEVRYESVRQSFTPNIRFSYLWDKVLEITPNYRLQFTRNKFDLDDFDNQEFLTHFAGIQTSTFVPKNVEWRNDIAFTYNPNVAPGFQKSAWFWNTTLAYSFLKDNAILSLKVYDLLNQNTNARRTATDNFIQDSQSTVLQQYFMLSFSWKFNSLGQKGETKDDMFFMF